MPHVAYVVHDHYWEDRNLLAGLRQAGAEVSVVRPGHSFTEALGFDWEAADTARVSERLVRELGSLHRRKPIDLAFCYLIDPLSSPEAISALRDAGILMVNYWCNGAHQFNLVERISPAFDVCVSTERATLPLYRAVGANPLYLQLAANPELYAPRRVPLAHDVTFVGQRYADRPVYIDFLLKRGIDVRVWGPGWTGDRTYGEDEIDRKATLSRLLEHPRSVLLQSIARTKSRLREIRELPPPAERRLRRVAGPSLPYEELVALYSASRISLGFSTVGDARYGDRDKRRQIHLRDFEAPMSGATYMTEYQEELEDFYALDDEIVTYSSREELAEKIEFHLARPERITAIREAGRARALADHTWERRFGTLFDHLGLSA